MPKSAKLFGSTPPGRYRARSIDGNAALPTEAIFPIISQNDDGTFIPIGTGFFISTSGIFITAAHVIQEVLDQNGRPKGPFGLFQLSLDKKFLLRPILTTTRHISADVAVGIAAPMHNIHTSEPLKNKVLVLASNKPRVGTVACTYAFPKTTVSPGKPQIVHFTPDYFEGSIQQHYPSGRDSVMLPGPCFETTIVLHGAASGGPVFNETGHVFGINSTGYNDSPISFVSCISSALELSLDNIVLPGVMKPSKVVINELVEKGLVATSSSD